MNVPNKNLGQHWLNDATSLRAICQAAKLNDSDTVLEIGPGLGSLTRILTQNVKKVVAVEYDQLLAQKLSAQFKGSNVEVQYGDILNFNLTLLPKNYKVVANLPYYITSKIVNMLLTSTNAPSLAVLLVQKEVAQRMAAKPGELSVLGVATQFYAIPKLGNVIKAELFTPPPKVDSQIISLYKHKSKLFESVNEEAYFRLIKAGFSERRKKLRSSLSGGLQLSKTEADKLLNSAGIDSNTRAQELTLEQWANLTNTWNAKINSNDKS